MEGDHQLLLSSRCRLVDFEETLMILKRIQNEEKRAPPSNPDCLTQIAWPSTATEKEKDMKIIHIFLRKSLLETSL